MEWSKCDLCVTSVAVSPYNPSIKSKTWSERFFQRNFLRRSRKENFFEKRKPERGDKTFLIYLYYREWLYYKSLFKFSSIIIL